jgi:hypothetical protein
MTVYKAIKASEISRTIVEELNAAVLIATFHGKGVFKADLYTSVNSCPALVMHGTCAPVHADYKGTYNIEI